MNFYDFVSYLQNFEDQVIRVGAEKEMLGKEELVPIRNGKLLRRPFGKALGREINCDAVVAVDYYGHIKKSTGFFRYAEQCSADVEGQLKMISSVLVHFARIRIEDVYRISKSSKLIGRFPEFKEEMLRLKGFKK